MYRGSFHGDLVFGESSGEAPVCADCHEAHNIMPPESQEFRAQIDSLCAKCHADALKTYLDSYHGKAFFLGDLKTAVCTDCHGGHRILAPSDPESSVNEANLIETCGECHPGANDNFVQFMVHVDPKSPSSSFLVWTFYARVRPCSSPSSSRSGSCTPACTSIGGSKMASTGETITAADATREERCARASSTGGSTSSTAGCTSSSS